MKILKRSNKSKFKTAIINPLLDHNFIELTIPDSPKSPSQKYRLTGKFVKKRTKE
jgi:ATP-dependent DNA helicase RecG